jgi:RNA polymerase subunit RPABC4/transcription elongation factor Spt4
MTFLKMPDGTTVHVRQAKRRAKRCKVCRRLTNERWLRECDWPMPNGKTCDLLMCTNCAEATGPNTDLCPVHSIETKQAKAVALP